MLFAVKNYGGYLTGDKNRFFYFCFFHSGQRMLEEFQQRLADEEKR